MDDDLDRMYRANTITRAPRTFAVDDEQLRRFVDLVVENDDLTRAQVLDLFVWQEQLWTPSTFVAAFLAHRSVQFDQRVLGDLVNQSVTLSIEGTFSPGGVYFTGVKLGKTDRLADIVAPRCVRCGELMGARHVGARCTLGSDGFVHYPDCPSVNR